MITVGWRELVGLPELGLKRVPAKIDSGARTSEVLFPGTKVQQVCEAVHVDVRGITSSNGETQLRYVIKTPLTIGDITFRAEISLADRSDMKFPMLIGRSALRRRFLVDSGNSWLQTPGREPVKGHKP